MSLNALVTLEVLGLPKPPDMTIAEALAEDEDKNSDYAVNDFCSISRKGWIAWLFYHEIKDRATNELIEWEPDKKYDTNMADAWLLAEHLKHRWCGLYSWPGSKWACSMYADDNPIATERVVDDDTGEVYYTRKQVHAGEETAQLAITVCALLACGVSKERIEQARKTQ